jgi:hypothetical protein
MVSLSAAGKEKGPTIFRQILNEEIFEEKQRRKNTRTSVRKKW